jgi:hypothetical protein
MSKLPNVREVVAHVLKAAEHAEAEKTAAEAPPAQEYTTDVAKSLQKLAAHLRSSSVEVTYEDVNALGRKLLEAS